MGDRPGCSGPIACLAAGLLFLVTTSVQAMQGRSLQEVIEEQRAAGLRIVYSTALVPPSLRVLQEPLHREPVLLLEEILAPHGLGLAEADGIYFVVRPDETATTPPAAEGKPPQAEEDPSAGPLELDRMNVSASRYVLWSNSQFYVDQRAIQALPGLGEDPVRSAQRLPGAAAGGVSSKAHFRGGGHDETAIYLNGMKLLDPFHIRDYHSIFSTIDAKAISGVEAYTGGFPAAYGDRMSGLLVMETRAPEEPLETELGLSVYNTSVLNSGHAADGSFDWLFSARRSNLDLVLSDDLGKPDYFDVFTSLGAVLAEGHRLSLNALYADDRVLVITENDPAEIEQSRSDTRNRNIWLSMHSDWTPRLSSLATLSWSSMDNLRVAEVNDPERMVATVDDRRSADILGLQFDVSYIGIPGHEVTVGGEVRRVRARYDYRSQARYRGFYTFYPGLDNPTQSRIRAAPEGGALGLYLSDRWRLTSSTGLELGLRWDRQTWTEPRFDDQISPRLSLLHRLAGGTELRLTWGRYYQSQGVQELQVEDGVDRFFAPQRADHWIAGIRHRFANGYRLRAELFSKDYGRLKPRFENLYDPLAMIPELAPDRLRLDPGSARARGLELTVEYRGGGELDWWAAYSLSRASDRIDGTSQARSWDQRHAVQAGLAWRPGAWEVGLALSLHSGWPRTTMSFAEAEADGEAIYLPVPGPRNADRYSTFAQVDVRVSREFSVRKGRLSAFLELTNATNRNNPCCVDYDLDEDDQGNVFLDSTVDHWLPLLPAIGLHWAF